MSYSGGYLCRQRCSGVIVEGIKPGSEVFVEILAHGGVPARLDAGGVLGPGQSPMYGVAAGKDFNKDRGAGLDSLNKVNLLLAKAP